MIISNRLSYLNNPVKITGFENKIQSLGFDISNDITHYVKSYNAFNNKIAMKIICADDVMYDIDMVIYSNKIPCNKTIIVAEEILNKNTNAIMSMKRTAQTMGIPGGSGGLTNINVDESLGGPRWWRLEDQASDVNDLIEWIQKQQRYNPEYFPVGDGGKVSDETPTVHVATVPGQPSAVSIGVDRQEPFIQYLYPYNNNVNKIKINVDNNTLKDLAQEKNKYSLYMNNNQNNQTDIFLKKINNKGGTKGIWEINKGGAVPGFAYIDGDARTSYSLSPELLDDKGWTSGDHSPGRVGFGYPETWGYPGT